MNTPAVHGRGSPINPANRFTRISLEVDGDYLDAEPDLPTIRTQFFTDAARTVVTSNNSPDVPFRFSLNPYRGCEHGCSYCFARPTHEYFGLGAGLDFETKIFVKRNAPQLFRDWLARDTWRPEMIVLSGVADCYQPVERRLGITRACLKVAHDARQPIGIVTKNALVERDADILSEMAKRNLARVNISVTTLDAALARAMEPRTSSPVARLRAIATLRAAGVPVNVLVAPIIPGLTDHEVPAILKAVKQAGALSAGYVLLRLPGAVAPVFLDWLHRQQPNEYSKVESRIRATRNGNLYENNWGRRMSGRGEIAGQIHRTFNLFLRKFGLNRECPALSIDQFRRPLASNGQQRLFD